MFTTKTRRHEETLNRWRSKSEADSPPASFSCLRASVVNFTSFRPEAEAFYFLPFEMRSKPSR
jgi:hypothetical protein